MTRRGLQQRLFVLALSSACFASVAAARAPDEPLQGRETAVAPAKESSQWRRMALTRALDAAGAIDDPYRRAEAFTRIARVQMLVEDSSGADRSIHHALAAAQRVAEPAFRGWALHEIVLAQIDAEDPYGARQTAARIEARRPQGAAFAALAEVQLRSGNIDEAGAIAKDIRDPGAAGDVLRQIVVIRCARGELDAARAILRDIHDRFYRALALGDVAVAEVRSGHVDRANALAARASRSERGDVYGRIAVARADAGDLKGAAESLQEIADRLHRAAVQGRIAAGLAVAGNASGAKELFASAIVMAESASDQQQRRAKTFAQLARMQIAGGERESAGRTLQRAQSEAGQLEPGERREETLDYIGRTQMLMEDAGGALKTAARMNDRVMRALLVRDVIALQPDVTAASATAQVAAFDDPLVGTAALFGVLGAQFLGQRTATGQVDPPGAEGTGAPGTASTGDLRGKSREAAGKGRGSGQSAFLDTIDATRAAVRRIDDVQLQPAAFAALAAARAVAGDMEAGRSIFEEALAAAGSIEQPQRRAAAYVHIVDALDDRLVFLGRPTAGKP